MKRAARIGEIMIKYLLILLLTFFTINANAGEWNDKPVMCAPTKETLKAIQSKGEILLITGVQSAKVRNPDEPNGLAANPVHLALQIFINLQTKTFTIIEYHPSYDSVCILAYGDDFSSLLLESM